MLRFAFIEEALGAGEAARFLKQYCEELTMYVPELERFRRSETGRKMPLSARLALECGIEEYKARLQWAVKWAAIYQQMEKRS